MTPERVLLHLGTHKTATTHIQMSLRSQSTRLQQQDQAYIPLQKLRSTVTRLVWDDTATARSRRSAIDNLCKQPSLIVSDENLLGFPREIRSGRLYRQGERNLRRLTEALPQGKFRALIALRGYAGFLVSMYCEYLRHNPYVTFRNFSRRTPLPRMTWMPLLEGISRAIGSENLQVVFFEEVKSDLQPVFDWFGDGLTAQPARGPGVAQRRRATLSAAAIDELARRASNDSPGAARALLNQWEQAGESPPGSTYSPFNARQLKLSDHRYEIEKAQIKARFGSLT